MPPKVARVSQQGKLAGKQGSGKQSSQLLDFNTTLTIFFSAHLLGALFSPIQDCDEVFNFWEPTHYLNHGYGLQTWELSPVYAIRSWLYVSLHAIPIYFISILPFVTEKTAEFYAMRVILGFACALCETRLFTVISQAMSPRVAVYYLLVTVTSAGTFHAATAYLPSSFAMLCVTLAYGSFMNWRGAIRTGEGLMWLGIGTIIGWPFIGILAAPFVVEELITSFIIEEWVEMLWRLADGFVRSLVILAFEVLVDSCFFKKLVCVPLNIVIYNIFAGEGKGPDIYGTEPWHFYLRNLFINFNLWFLLALASVPLLLLHQYFGRSAATKLAFYRTFLYLTPFYIWLGVMTLQPHKEERFMYPIYPCLALNAALSLHILLQALGTSPSSSSTSKQASTPLIPGPIKLLLATGFVLTASILGVWRSLGLATAYNAPFSVYARLHDANLTVHPTDTVCVGKEWYRFPSSYHLPAGVHLKFVKSNFAGLLPGEFSEAPAMTGLGLFPGAWLIPSGMNDRNEEDIGKYTDIERCTYLVDSVFDGAVGDALEPVYAAQPDRWETVACEPFLDAGATGVLGRLGWVPEGDERVPKGLRRKWGKYCLLKQKQKRA